MGTEKSLSNYRESIITPNEAINVMLDGKRIGNAIIVDNQEIDPFNQYARQVLGQQEILNKEDTASTEDEFHNKRINQWNFPNKYKQISVLEYLINKCKTDEQIERVATEYIMYEERELVILLQFFIYLVDYMRKNNFIWGVGRGSSVASYILYLIGIHKIDSIKYNLNIKEFLK